MIDRRSSLVARANVNPYCSSMNDVVGLGIFTNSELPITFTADSGSKLRIIPARLKDQSDPTHRSACAATGKAQSPGCRTTIGAQHLSPNGDDSIHLLGLSADMQQECLELAYAGLEAQLLPRLKEKVFHVTSRQRFERIVRSGAVINNADGLLGDTYPQSAISLGRRRGWVSLFDLRNKSDEDIDWGLRCFYFLAPAPLGDDIVFLFLNASHYRKLIQWDDIRSVVPIGEFHIPHVECWYENSVPFSAFAEVLHVRVHRPPIAPDSLLAAIIASREPRDLPPGKSE